MLSQVQTKFLIGVKAAARLAQHIYPGAAAAEAALESNWGLSKLAVQAKNLFGLKKPSTWTGQTINLPTQEFVKGHWVAEDAIWPVFTSWQECLEERMNVLRDNGIYDAALIAPSPEQYIVAVSRRWATDPNRAAKVLAIYHSHLDLLR